jgi:hypothetical protein
MINLVVNNKYAYHIAYILYLLGIPYTLSTTYIYDIIDDLEYKNYYKKVITNLNRETKFYLDYNFLIYFIKNNLNINQNNNNNNIILTESSSIITIEQELYKELKNHNIIPEDIQIYTNELLPRETFISWSIFKFYNRDLVKDELDFHNQNTVAHKINIVTWLLIIRFCNEGISLNLPDDIINLIKTKKYFIPGCPNIAIILHSHARHFTERYIVSHRQYLVDNPYFDIFIHIWSDIGHKYEMQLLKINPVDILNRYNPKSLNIENVWDKYKSEFSLVGKFYPIFLKNSQDKADASQYVNANLYSVRHAYKLLEIYESNNNFIYNGIIKWNFDTDITYLDMKLIWDDMQEDILWFKKGCSLCDHENLIPNPVKRHVNHKNDLDTSWYYGNRYYMGKALKLSENAFDIANSYQVDNILNMVNVPYRHILDFVYIYEDVQLSFNINTKIVCYHPHTLMKEYLKNFYCKTCLHINGEIIKPAVFNNNL